MTKFSPQLKERIIQYFRKRNGLELTQEQAEQYLDSLADLFPFLTAAEKPWAAAGGTASGLVGLDIYIS